MTTTHDHGMMMTTTDPHAMHRTTTDPHAMHRTTTDPHAMHRTTTHDHSGHGGDGGHDGHGGHAGGHMMVMHGGISEIVVFAEWKTHDIGTFIATCIGLFLIAFCYEGIKYTREQITKMNIITRRRIIEMESGVDNGQLKIDEGRRRPQQTYFQRLLSLEHLVQLVLHVVQFFISYFLMLAVMTYNTYLCISILAGIAVGFFFFGVRRTKINLEEDCH